MAKLEAIKTGRWSVGLDHDQGTVIKFEFLDAEPIVLLVPHSDAQAIALEILAQYKNPPPKPDRLS